MTTNQIKHAGNTPVGFMALLKADWRKEKLQQIRALILAQDPDITESISYNMLAFQLHSAPLFHLNAQKNYVSLYCDDISKIDPDGKILAGLNVGKGCIRITKTKNIAETNIADYIKQSVLLLK